MITDNTSDGFRLFLDGTADGPASMELRIPSFGTNFVHRGYQSDTRCNLFIGDTDNDSNATKNNTNDNVNGSFAHLTSDLTLGIHQFGINAVSGQNGNTSAFDVATPTHSSSHYQSFESPFLHELIGGDRNMEQTNLVVSPDGRTWDSLTRNTGYLSQTKVSVQIDHDSSSGNIIFDEWRGQNDTGLNAFNKNFAIGYDRLICLEAGMYQLNVIFSASGSGSAMGISIYVNGNQTSAQFADHESGERSSVAYSAVLTLKRDDYVQINNSGTVEGTDPQYNQFSVVKL